MSINVTKKIQKGFSIGEVLLATFLLLIGIVALLKMSVGNLRQVSEAKKIVVATELAQEGLELVRNARELNFGRYYLSVRNNSTFHKWIGFFDSRVSGGIDYKSYYDFDTNMGLQLSSITGLKRDGYGFYILSNDPNVEFHRVVRIIKHYHRDSFLVRVLVTWGESPIFNSGECNLDNKCVFMEQELTDWPGKI